MGSQGRSKLGDGGAVKPMIGPEFAGAVVTQNLGSGSSKDLLDLMLALWRKTVPRALTVSRLEPQPAHPKSNVAQPAFVIVSQFYLVAPVRFTYLECRATRIAQTAPVSAVGARRSPSPMVNAATGLEAQEQQGSSQPATEPIDGRTATPLLARPSGSASRARLEMPHGRRALAMATELLRYRPAPDHQDDWCYHIEELIAAACNSAALSCSLRPQPSLANEEQDAPPHLSGVSRTSSPGRKCDPAPGLVKPGWGPGMKQVAR
ncbi:Polypyrimidine tract-binding protein-like protein 1 [Hordeum vulgare]|nr:Polypyrimidine tract-binding protein-like protein 1 [Hordeum vulgare]